MAGANLKAATSAGAAVGRPFPLWKQPERLTAALRSLLEELRLLAELRLLEELPQAVAVTMTGELADGYADKAEGVRQIVAAATAAAGGLPVRVWGTGEAFLPPAEAAGRPMQVAAANWHALGTFVARMVPAGPGLLIDIGSTTTDLIPLENGRVAARGLTDLGRLRAGELVYSGATRTPLCALGPRMTVAGETIPLAAEFFATTRDLYLISGDLPADPADRDTADGRPATVAAARRRIAKMLCCDVTELGEAFVDQLAAAFAARQQKRLAGAVQGLLDRFGGAVPRVVLLGSGAFLARQVLAGVPQLATAETISLAEAFGPPGAGCACAFAVARLLAEDFPSGGG